MAARDYKEGLRPLEAVFFRLTRAAQALNTPQDAVDQATLLANAELQPDQAEVALTHMRTLKELKALTEIVDGEGHQRYYKGPSYHIFSKEVVEFPRRARKRRRAAPAAPPHAQQAQAQAQQPQQPQQQPQQPQQQQPAANEGVLQALLASQQQTQQQMQTLMALLGQAAVPGPPCPPYQGPQQQQQQQLQPGHQPFFEVPGLVPMAVGQAGVAAPQVPAIQTPQQQQQQPFPQVPGLVPIQAAPRLQQEQRAQPAANVHGAATDSENTL